MSVVLCLGIHIARAEPAPADDPVVTSIDRERDFTPGTHERFTQRVNSAQSTEYHAVLAAYEARRVAHPDDVTSQIERCRFIETFAYSEDGFIESAEDDLTKCRDDLKSGVHSEDADVLLYGVESNWGETGMSAAQALIPRSENWSRDEQSTLFALLAERAQWNDPELAASYAIRSVELDPASRVLLIAVNRWVQVGAKERARRLLLDAPPAVWKKVSRTQAAKVLIDLGDSKGATAILRDAGEGEEQTEAKLTLARVLTGDGDLATARELYSGAIDGAEFVAQDTRVEYFEFERRHGTAEAASEAYEKLRDEGFHADSLARHRLGLLVSHPGAGWHWRDALGLLTLVGVALAICALPLVAIVPVHYRGLARRVAGRAPDRVETHWQLRHAWYALGVVLFTGYAAAYVFAVSYIEVTLPWTNQLVIAPITDTTLAKIMLWSTVAALLLLLPIMRGRPIKAVVLGNWSVKRSILVGIGVALILKFVAVLFALGTQSLGMLGSDTTRAMQGLNESYGLVMLLLVVAVAAPLLEEWVFRGVMLDAFRGRVTFWFAAVIQALAFVALHEEWQALPFLFTFALVAAWLVMRSGGLLASMVMHGVNNAFAALAIVGVTKFLNS